MSKFELKVPIEELRKRPLFIGTPMYGGQCSGMYCKSMVDLSSICSQYGIPLQVYYLFNESLITRARNYICDEFLRSNSNNLMFIDSDIGFNPHDVIALLAMQSEDSEYDVLCGPYPKKCISWEKIKQAVDKGVADDNPNILDKFVGDFVFNPVNSGDQIPLNSPAQVLEGGTGFMMIRRKAFSMFKDKYPHLSYKPDHVRSEAFDGSREILAYFDTVIDPDSKRYLSEDYMFCQYIRNIGGKVWMCPWMELQHVGSYVFGGSVSALASIGASATADVGLLKKSKKK
jgi:hypothetical protein